MKYKKCTICLYLAILTCGAGMTWADTKKTAVAGEPVEIILHPAPAPTPALKYQLLPPYLERRPGNAAVHYLKFPHVQQSLMSNREFWEALHKCQDMPLPELQKEKDTDKGKKLYSWVAHTFDGNGLIGNIELGARCESCDWQVPIRDYGFNTLLPEIQSSRDIGHIFAARARLQMADGRYDDAMRSLQTGYAVARHVGRGTCFVQCLVGARIADMMSHQVETFIQQPDAPNLYWALSFLPQPLIDYHKAYEVESGAHILFTFPELRDLDDKDYTPDQWRKLLERTIDKMVQIGRSINRPPHYERFQTMALMIELYPRAKRFLIAEGRSAAEVEAMPVAKAILIYLARTAEIIYQDSCKSAMLPYPVAIEDMKRTASRLKREYDDEFELFVLTNNISQTASCFIIAQGKLQRKIAALRIFETLRIYAAAHDGRLPKTLADVKKVPIPLDPLSGKAFEYHRQDEVNASLKSPVMPFCESLNYRIKLAGKGAEK